MTEQAFPPFDLKPEEAFSFSLMQLLAGKKPSLSLSPEALKKAENLAQAFRQGNKVKAFQFSAELFEKILAPELLKSAYLLVEKTNPQHPSPEYQIVMDSLRDACLESSLPLVSLPLERALQFLLLSLTRSDKNSIFYNRIDPQTGKQRPTTFPLTEKLIESFLSAFPEASAQARKVLIRYKGQVLGNPAALIASDYKLRLEKYQREREKWEAQRPVSQTRELKAAPKKEAQPQLISEELMKVLNGTREPAEREALVNSLKPDNFAQLLSTASLPGKDFNSRFEKIISQGLSPAKASLLSARMALRMKNLMAEMGNWKEDYWQEFQSNMQTLGIWEGQEWLEKWRSDKQGKQHLEKSGKAYLIEDQGDPLKDALAKMDTMQSKQKGQKMLSAWQMQPLRSASEYKASPEEKKLLSILSRADRLDEFLELAISDQHFEEMPVAMQGHLYQVFSLLSGTDLDWIKMEFLAPWEADEASIARKLIVNIERAFQRLLPLFKRDFRMTFPLALKMIREQEELIRQQQRRNTREFQNTPAAVYQRYQEG
ncbi:hypothetical protein COW36_17025 [bacterium (Candidatus Blackallbacteria) CG17_big_fil_post_rev_8_21_14_2_50_48_46]|uniref:Uncharacterized protein n=1 Tax=bacterium (Candidatus Blackallbacteria) CG17_big_fil_post_rev_8_21_14_2_50_48_46 TaxID=2014261 RepID=A0A2M7G1B0_9BACT|nr:MAG: hypothetical protein COW64_09335 [bacterium (Candidatus Blackallbacteria) CG18_big_fil_WC_8_21_14_2_50_49_26]PIW15505.1 MAG: hypothetical protein COW36_17025 [bacterium (Candidatus Blackallbacteria) CG17_big_fil_post_rev_8_21_14_2_50_48_46]PIW48595.1 MAG: hypothetical protein COW20_08820 [bacterium (Candidatus Blackallbacteria) CG13_big_fil_rev_8_21_14_2_50_49_14]